MFPPAEAPYFRVRYEAPAEPKAGELPYAVNYTIWIPPGVKTLRGVVVHQHGCGEGSCKSGLTGAFDLHWQALAATHGCRPSALQDAQGREQLALGPGFASTLEAQGSFGFPSALTSTFATLPPARPS